MRSVRAALLSSLLLTAFLVPRAADAQGRSGADRPDILWLVAEDMGPELGAYG